MRTYSKASPIGFSLCRGDRWLLSAALLLIAAALALLAPAITHAQAESVVVHAVPGDPLNVAVESPGHVWYTLPEQNAVGSLIVDEAGIATTRLFTLPQADSRPYDIAYANGTVWFTEHNADKIGAINVASGELREFEVHEPAGPPTNATTVFLPTILRSGGETFTSQPTGIAVAPNGIVWFVIAGANQLGRSDPITESIELFFYPQAGANLEDVSVGLSNSPWFTAPGVDAVVKFDYRDRQFYEIQSTGEDSWPFSIVVARSDTPWVTAPGRKQVGYYLYGTASLWLWFPQQNATSELRGIARSATDTTERIWFTDGGNNTVNQYVYQDDTIVLQSISLNGWAIDPAGIAVDGKEHAWIAVDNAIVEWKPPYF